MAATMLPSHGTIILKEGYLIKRSKGNKLVSNWRRRYFRLQPGELLYFESPQEVAPRRRIPLGLDSTVSLTNDQGYNLCFMLQSTPTSDKFYVQAATETEKKAWVDAIFEVLRRAKDVLNQPDPSTRFPRRITWSHLFVGAGLRPNLVHRRSSRTPTLQESVHLNVRVAAAKGLIAADARGTSDSYCVVTLVDKGGHFINETKRQTKVNGNDLAPVWNFDTVFGDKIDLTLVDEVRFDLYDQDLYTKDECIGTVSVPMGLFKMSVASATSSETIDHWFQIAPPPQGARPTTHLLNLGQNTKVLNERDHGELHVIMSLSGEKLPAFFQSLERSHYSPKKEMIANNFDETDNRLEVSVVSAKGLVYLDPKDNAPSTAINPLAEVHVLDVHKRLLHRETYRSGIQFRTIAPTFSESSFVCGRHAPIDQAGYVKVTILHAERGDRFIPLGSVTIDLNEVSAYKLTKWYPLESAPGPDDVTKHVGDVRLELCLIGESRGEKLQKEATRRAITAAGHTKTIEQTELDNAQFQMLLAERHLDGAKIACAEKGYQVRHPSFYGVNGYLHAAHAQLVHANRRHQTPDHVFQNRGLIEGYALLDVSIVGVQNLTVGDRTSVLPVGTYAKLEVEPTVAIIAGKKVSKPYLVRKAKSPKKSPTHRVLQHPEDRDDLNGGMVRQAIWGKKPLTAEADVMADDRPYLRVRVVSGHSLLAGDMNGYSDPYCTIFLTDTHDVPYKKEKKKTAVVNKTLNPVWQHEEFTLGYDIDLNNAKTLLLHVKDHNNIGHATPLGRVEIPLQDLCQGSATTTSIATVAMTKRYRLVPEPWMKQERVDLGELCLETEMIGNATVLANLLVRQKQLAAGMLSFHSSHSLVGSSDAPPTDAAAMEDEETIFTPGQHIRTYSTPGNDPQWPGDRFQLQLAYPALLTDSVPSVKYRDEGFEYDVRVTVLCGRNMLNCDRNSEADPFFTIYPVWPTGEVVHAAKQQSLTVYESRNPVWPTTAFTFGHNFDVTKISHLAIHFYDRDWGDLDTSCLAALGDPSEVDNSAWLPRHLLHKVSPAGDVDKSGARDMLEYDQKVLAFRRCGAGGNYFPGRVRHYTPFPSDTYLVLFDDELNSISLLKKLLSYDAMGEIMHVRNDGSVDIQLHGEKKTYVPRVPLRLLTPIKAFPPAVDTTLAAKRPAATAPTRAKKWTSVRLHVLSLAEMRLPENVNAAVVVSLLAAPDAKHVTVTALGEIVGLVETSTRPPSPSRASMLPLPETPKTFVVPSAQGASLAHVDPWVLEGPLLDATDAFLFRIVDQGSGKEATKGSTRVLGMAKLDVQSLLEDHSNQHLKIFPEKTLSFDTFYGVLQTRTSCTRRPVDDDVIEESVVTATLDDGKKGVDEWYADVLRKEAETSLGLSLRSLLEPGNHVELSYLARRQALRGALSARQNRQVDNLGFALNAVYRHVLSVLRAIELFDEYEGLSHDDQRKFSAMHCVSALGDHDEWLYRRLNDMPLHVRKKTVVDLEMHLLELAGATTLPEVPLPDASRDEWLRMRTLRWDAINQVGDFLPLERGFVLKYAACFTGSGLISWILRLPSVLWKDGWTAFAVNEVMDDDALLGWEDPALLINTEAMQAPESREHALVWLKALFDAGYIESVSDKRDFADGDDRYYRLHGLEHERLHQKRKDSTFPLDLVQEIDCQTKSKGELFCKRLTDHASGFLGTQSTVSNLIGSAAMTVEAMTSLKVPHLTLPNVANALSLSPHMLWDWKYALFIPGAKHEHKYIYLYDSVHATNASIAIDLSGARTFVTYSNAAVHGDDCFEVRFPTFFAPDPVTNKLCKLSDADVEAAFASDVSHSIVLKATDSQVWVQAMLLAGVKVVLEKRQKVLFQRLNNTVLEAKCVKANVPFNASDPEGSFQHLINAVFGHDKASQHSSDKQLKELRSRIRSELKKTAALKEPVTAKYGQSGIFDPPPTDARKFTRSTEYPARISKIATPFTDANYPVKVLYKLEAVPPRMQQLLKTQGVRDLFLLYDVEYHHKNETIIEKHLLREDFHTMDGDLDPLKVHSKCVDLNVVFKPHDLEGCVSLFTTYENGETPMGRFRIPIQALSDTRELDWWFKLMPERGMLQRRELGSIRVRIEMRKHPSKTCMGSLALPPPVAQRIEKAITTKVHNQPESWLRRKRSGAAATAKPKAPVRSVLHIDVLEGRKLIVCDIRTSDPFVQLYLVGSKNGKDDEVACGKTDIVPNTLNPRWTNQGFTLGRGDDVRLDDKKALILRVFDHDSLSSNDPMGCLRLEFDKDHLGYIRRLKLHHAGPSGKETPTWLALDDSGEVEVFERLMRDTKAGQLAWAKARGNSEDDGVLGRLRFRVKVTHCDFTEAPETSANAPPVKAGSPLKPGAQTIIRANPAHSDLTRFGLELTLESVYGKDKKATVDDASLAGFTLAFAPRTREGHLVSYDVLAEQATHDGKAPLLERLNEVILLGTSYDVTRVASYDVVLHHTERGSSLLGSLAVATGLANSTLEIECLNRDTKDVLQKVVLSFNASYMGLHRAEYVERVLAETYAYAGLDFDPRSIASLGQTAETFLWETCHQLTKLYESSRLHWQLTPKLLFFLLHHNLSRGKDRLPAVAEAKGQLTGRLHGELTPRLIATLSTLCDWSGGDTVMMAATSHDTPQTTTTLHVGDTVHAHVAPALALLPGAAVDVRSSDSAEYIAGVVACTYADAFVDVICPPISDDLSLTEASVVYVRTPSTECTWKTLRSATVTDIKANDGTPSYRVRFDDDNSDVWLPRTELYTYFSRVGMDLVSPLLLPNTHVRVVHEQTNRAARVVRSMGGAMYEVAFVEGGGVAKTVRRGCLAPLPTHLVRGVVSSVRAVKDGPPVYDLVLDNANVATDVSRDALRLEDVALRTDALHLCAAYVPHIKIGPTSVTAESIQSLWGGSSVVQTYLELPSSIKSVAVRDAVTGAVTPLGPRTEAAPTVFGQYHGYLLGTQWSDADKAKAAAVRQMSVKELPLPNLLSLLLAPAPHVCLTGTLAIAGANTVAFQAALSQWTSQLLAAEMRRVITLMVHAALPIDAAPTAVAIHSITSALGGKPVADVVVFREKGTVSATYKSTGKALTQVPIENLQLLIDFEVRLTLPTTSSEALSTVASSVLDRAKAVADVLQAQTSLVFVESTASAWSFDADDIACADANATLSIQVAKRSKKDQVVRDWSAPPTSELVTSPLADVHLLVTTTDNREHDVTLAAYDLKQECDLRHELLPRFQASLVTAPAPDGTSVVRFHDAKDATSVVDASDIALDAVHVDVLKAHDLHTTKSTRKGSVGDYMDEEISVRLFLMTSDVPSNAGGKNRIGLTVNADGAILKDLKGQEYPKSTETVRSAHKEHHKPSVDWESAKKAKRFTFGQPRMALEYATKLVFEVMTSGSGAVLSGQSTTGAASTFASANCLGFATLDLATLPKHAKELSIPLYRKGHPEDREPRGSLTLRVQREQLLTVGATVHVRRCAPLDKWVLCPHELVLRSLRYKTKHAERGLVEKLHGEVLASAKGVEHEHEVQKLLQLVRLDDDQTGFTSRTVSVVLKPRHDASSYVAVVPPMTLSQVSAADVIAAGRATADAVVELLSPRHKHRRLKWSADFVEKKPTDTEHVVADHRSPFEVATDRLRSTLLKLHYVSTTKLIPMLDKMALLSVSPSADFIEAERILTFFEDEVDELDHDDAMAFERLDKKTRVAKLTQLLGRLLKAYVRVSILVDHETRGAVNNRMTDEVVGMAIIPLLDLLDQRQHNRQYQLHLDRRGNDGLCTRELKKALVHIKTQLSFSELSMLETAINIFKDFKKNYIDTFEVARRRVTAAVVPAQRRRWQTLMGYLETLSEQSVGKMHWETTPTLLEHVWDIFLSHKRQFPSQLLAFAPQIVAYRDAVVKVHARWVNLQPMLQELLEIQSRVAIDATRTPDLLEAIQSQVEGLDVLRRNAWDQVEGKWLSLRDVLEELVSMQERNKLHMARAPLLLKFVSDHCSKGLNPRHADAVAAVQFRWIALTKHDGPINELRLMETHGLHWRRTYDLLRLLDEQCEGFSDVDAKALGAVKERWAQVENWLNGFLEMQQSQMIHCQQTPYALRKFLLIRDHDLVRSKDLGVEHDSEQVEGMLEWYAHEEAKRELIRLPHHRITTDAERDDWLQYSENGRDARLLITKDEMRMNAENVRAALLDRGVLPASMPWHEIARIRKATGQWPKVVLDEIDAMDAAVDKNELLRNPERVVELSTVLEDVGKGDLLWKVKHCVNENKETAIPITMKDLLFECQRRGLATTELDALLKGLATTLQKEELTRRNIPVPANASVEKVCSILVAHQVTEVPLPIKITDIQDALVARHLDKKGDAQYVRGVRVNTLSHGALGNGPSPLGIVDSHVELLRKQLLMEAMRKRNSLIKTFPVASQALLEETADVVELDMSGSNESLVDRFHAILVHETYCIKLASYAALDRCARALVGVPRDQVMTKEDMALCLQKYNARLPATAFTRDELFCPSGGNAAAMAYYAALRTTAIAFQEQVPFTGRVATNLGVVDAMPFEVPRELLSATALPLDRSKLTLGYVVVDWLLGNDDTPVELRSANSKYYLQRLQWVSAALTIRDRWWTLGRGWCDLPSDIGVGVKVLLDQLILMAGENKMHMTNAERLLKEINEKCIELRLRENDALENILFRFNENMALLEELVEHAERCINNRKLHSERTPELLHLIQQHCVTPKGLSTRHQEAYRVVTTHWLPHGRQLEELVQMHKEGTFSIHRTPEILEEMAHHTEGIAGSKETVKPADGAENNDAFSAAQLTEWRKGRRKSVLNEQRPGLSIEEPEVSAPLSTEVETWKSLAAPTATKANVSPLKRSVTWSFDVDATKDEAARPALPIFQLQHKLQPRKATLTEEVCELIKSPSKWFEPKKKTARIPPRLFFPPQVARDDHV
ncbi:hypothetical protein SPRG_10648 [Saprolegnia parasitica CBS 223.65]|uniref:Calmodulin n=1 Tax=Saprolegnia parasitica (strain CBS 223.65) TaxID=695850 RepID=A0A067CAV4_SAPPC|nr:hypothetical protein SPRG_10648 [Saprolegnia parasitica CBS 223.65]KDO23952.1 hypothetical protein SPRG_10648 [Saprolegnia parasitica CBS 223.65]|eukprot:XP_012205274.1 hypothetical protein SPRG_10648 [Saprolegnia parasitica CBS 223.65]